MLKLTHIASDILPAHRLFVCCLLIYFGVAQAESDHKDSVPTKVFAESTDVSKDSINESAESHPDFSGTWVLDNSASDNPEEIIKTSLDKRKKPSFSPGGGMPGRGPDMGRGGFGKPPSRDMDIKHPPAALSSEHLAISHSDPELRIIADQSDELTIYTDFRSTSVSALGGPQQNLMLAGWEGSDLVIEIRTLGGNVTILRLRLLENPRRLERVTEMPSPGPGGEPIVIKQIFNPLSDR